MTFIQRISVGIQVSRLFARMLATQVQIKVTKLARANTSIKDASAKPSKAVEIVRSMCQYDLELFRSCRNCLKCLAARKISSVSIYGANDIAEALSILSVETPVKICAIYDDFYTGRFASHDVRPLSDCATDRSKVIVAALVGVEERVERLLASGTVGDRLITLQRAGALRIEVSHDEAIAASTDQSSSDPCQSVV
jgi:hypothetical protein